MNREEIIGIINNFNEIGDKVIEIIKAEIDEKAEWVSGMEIWGDDIRVDFTYKYRGEYYHNYCDIPIDRIV